MLTTLPGVATSRAAAFADFSLPIARFPSAEHLYSATGPPACRACPACRLAYTLLKTQQPFDEQRDRRARHQSER